jgi:hypothetical protein
MGDLEFFKLDKDGAGWENISKADKETIDKIKKGMADPSSIKMLCFVCHKNIDKGNVCFSHKDTKGGIYIS